MMNNHIGSDFDDFLHLEGNLAEIEAVALKRVIAFQIEQEMLRNHLTRSSMAQKMNTSRASLNRLLNPNNGAVTLQTLERAAIAVGRKLKIELT